MVIISGDTVTFCSWTNKNVVKTKILVKFYLNLLHLKHFNIIITRLIRCKNPRQHLDTNRCSLTASKMRPSAIDSH